MTRTKSKALKDFEKALPKIYKGIKPVRTKSKLGTDKKLKSVSRRKPLKGYGSTSSTTLAREWDKNYKFHYHYPQDFWDHSYWYVLSRFLLLTGIILLVIWIIGRILI